MKFGIPSFGETPTLGNQVRPTRRSVLRTSAGVAVGLPFLTSLSPKGVQAATGPKRFVAFRTGHGGISLPNMVPPPSVSNEVANLYHPVKHGSLMAGVKKAGTDTQVSPVLTGPSNVLTDRLISKMNVLLGFDIPIYLGHSRGHTLGNFAESDQGPGDLKPLPTIDQVIAWSPQFYSSTAGVTQRSVVPFGGVSFAWSNPAARSGVVQKFQMSSNTQVLFDSLFGGFKPAPAMGMAAPPKRQPVVDRILADYKRLRNSDRRLSKEDKRRLDDHIAALDELDRRVKDSSGPSAMCDAKKPSTGVSVGSGNHSQQVRDYRLLNDVIAMALGCGVSRVATVAVNTNFADYSGSWHQDVAHQHVDPGKQEILVAANRSTFQSTMLDLAAKLDAFEDTPGVSLLDNSLVQWIQESGPNTHDNYAMTVVTFGSAGGFFKTGRFVDYRSGKKGPYGQLPGILYRQWLATALQAMGIPPSAYEEGGQPGYGDVRGSNGANYASGIFAQSGKPLPLITQS